MNNSNKQQDFQWTDELVKEVIKDIQSESGQRVSDHDFYINSFKQEKHQPIWSWEI